MMLKSEVVLITPEMAKKYLEKNTRNRPFCRSSVDRYLTDMRNNRWRLTHQGIAFNCDGTLLDGQHRLQAIIELGIPIYMMVTWNVDAEAQLNMDDHKIRAAHCSLSIVTGESVTSRDIGVIRSAVGNGHGKSRGVTKDGLLELIPVFNPALKFVYSHMGNGKYRGVTSAPVIAAICLAWFYVKDLDRLSVFCRVLAGIDLPQSDGDKAAVVLREWALRNGVSYSAERIEAFKKTQRAIVAFNERKDIGKLYGTSTFFPWPLIDPVRK
jgi:hypothetical protein